MQSKFIYSIEIFFQLEFTSRNLSLVYLIKVNFSNQSLFFKSKFNLMDRSLFLIFKVILSNEDLSYRIKIYLLT